MRVEGRGHEWRHSTSGHTRLITESGGQGGSPRRIVCLSYGLSATAAAYCADVSGASPLFAESMFGGAQPPVWGTMVDDQLHHTTSTGDAMEIPVQRCAHRLRTQSKATATSSFATPHARRAPRQMYGGARGVLLRACTSGGVAHAVLPRHATTLSAQRVDADLLQRAPGVPRGFLPVRYVPPPSASETASPLLGCVSLAKSTNNPCFRHTRLLDQKPHGTHHHGARSALHTRRMHHRPPRRLTVQRRPSGRLATRVLVQWRRRSSSWRGD
jgi:hypothetical protein